MKKQRYYKRLMKDIQEKKECAFDNFVWINATSRFNLKIAVILKV